MNIGYIPPLKILGLVTGLFLVISVIGGLYSTTPP